MLTDEFSLDHKVKEKITFDITPLSREALTQNTEKEGERKTGVHQPATIIPPLVPKKRKRDRLNALNWSGRWQRSVIECKLQMLNAAHWRITIGARPSGKNTSVTRRLLRHPVSLSELSSKFSNHTFAGSTPVMKVQGKKVFCVESWPHVLFDRLSSLSFVSRACCCFFTSAASYT